MQAATKKPRTEEDMMTLRLRVHRDNVEKIREYARLVESGGERIYTLAEVFPEYHAKEGRTALRAYRNRESLTQVELARLTGIPQHQISEMETGKRTIGKERARKLALALNVSDYRCFL